MKAEEVVRVSQEKVTDQREKLWGTVLLFLAGEWFGAEVLDEFPKYRFDEHPLEDGETIIDVTLSEHEKRMWDLVDTAANYLRKMRKRMPAGELQEKKELARCLKDQFWATIKLNHPELMEPDSIGIRKGYVMVESHHGSHHPLMEILKGAIPVG